MEIMEIRNNVIFNGVIPDTSSLLDDIKTSFSCQKKKKRQVFGCGLLVAMGVNFVLLFLIDV
jgi:hypothetical protein